MAKYDLPAMVNFILKKTEAGRQTDGQPRAHVSAMCECVHAYVHKPMHMHIVWYRRNLEIVTEASGELLQSFGKASTFFFVM